LEVHRWVIDDCFWIDHLLIGIDIGVTPVGQLFGSKLAKSNKIWIVALFGLFLGFVISVADLILKS
jgi:hypothetical protein